MAAKEPIGVVGVGWVGLCTAACFAELGHQVYARDILAEKVAALTRGEVPMHEPGLPELLSRNAERLHFTTEMGDVLDNAQLLFVCVDTPPTYSGDADLSRVEAVVAELGDSEDHAIVMKSTVPVGTGRAIQRRRDRLGYVSNPEFLKEGSAVADFMRPDRVVVGAGEHSDGFADRVAALFEPLAAPIVRTDVASAEMIKLASNAFLATKISFINEIANVSEELGADVAEVARGMGLDERIGDKFLKAGLGFGGSCLAGDETVLVRDRGRTQLLALERLWDRVDAEHGSVDGVANAGDALEVLSWIPGGDAPSFLPVMAVTRRDWDGPLLEVRTKTGRAVRCTPDHPWVVGDGADGEPAVKLASELDEDDWLPLAQGVEGPADPAALASLVAAAEAAELSPAQVIVRPGRDHVADVVGRALDERRAILGRRRPVAERTAEVARTGTMRLDEAALAGIPARALALKTATNGAEVASELTLDEAFWRVAGLYLAEGHATVGPTHFRLNWSFHPEREEHLVDEVAAYWLRHGLRVRTARTPTARTVQVSARLVTEWWTRVLGMGRNSYEQRLPDLVWDRPERDKWALLSGLFEGDGSWSLVNGGPSVIIELGTVSDELADGVLRLLGDLGVVASRRVGRTARSTKDTHWIRVSGAAQVERAIALVPARDRPGALASNARQAKRIAPTSHRRPDPDGPAWARVTGVEEVPGDGPVYSLEVPVAHTFVASGGLVTHNCFPKDVSALKQLAGNSGYHFQLLNSVIEVNDLQKRRAIGKLQKHLGSLVNREIALLGVAFKPHTDDIREATALVLAARLQSEGAHVRVFDPVALQNAEELLGGARVAGSALEALDGADAAVLVTEWPEFAELDWAGEVRERMAGAVVVDGRNFLDREALVAAGFTYEGIGR